MLILNSRTELGMPAEGLYQISTNAFLDIIYIVRVYKEPQHNIHHQFSLESLYYVEC